MSTPRSSRSPNSPRPGATSSAWPARARTTPTRCRRSRASTADPGHRGHPLPARVVCRDRRRLRRGRVNPGNIRSSTTRSPRDRRCRKPRAFRSGSASTPARWTSGCSPIRQGDPEGARRVGGLGGEPVRGARLPRLQDLGQAQRPGGDGPPTSCSPSAATGRRTSASPRPGRPSRARSSPRPPSARWPGHRRHHPGLPLRPAGRGGQGRHPDPSVAQPAPAQARDRLVCPSCGRAQVDVYTWPTRSPGPRGLTVPLRVAVMGCVVNGPGEAREADLGVASGNGKGQIFVRGEVVKTVPENQIAETHRGGAEARRGDGWSSPTAARHGPTVVAG